MDILDSKLPLLLRSAGLALVVLFVLGAGLSIDNPIQMAVYLVVGVAFGTLVYASGFVVERVREMAGHQAHAASDIRAQTTAVLALVEEIREAAEHN